ncbi:MAG: sigma-54-dependent Fis family transcriptional regulator [Candidatus Rokuibacteriota bacterium]|nr:MAG: sigma-54-dependent Fis family transcriptional regulator [Candidatus Rokubacteria bacterium]
MGFMSDEERTFSRAVSELALANPFLPERIVAEKKALGDAFIETGPVWHARPVPLDTNRNVQRIAERVGALVGKLRERLAAGTDPGADGTLYEELATYHLYARVEALLYELTVDTGPAARVEWFPRFAREVRHHFELPALASAAPPDPAQLVAFFFQVRRAFHFTMRNILGGSLPAARLRAAVWQAIFTHDMRRYRRGLWQRMHDVPTLIVGPTGSGKELVARAIGLSRHIPFQSAGQRFGEDFREGVFALNLSALSSTLIESELFGHRRGAFTGAVADRPGWLEVCPPLGTVFLDEIAEVDASIQVKLLRVLQTRTFQRVGDTQERRFQGKIVAATNRDLAAEMAAGRFRPDLYYRLCADVIETPSLAAILRDAPGELPALLRFLAARIAGEAEAEALAAAAGGWIRERLGPGYPWPGNVRELEQCIRNVMVRGTYHPSRAEPATPRAGLADAFLAGSLTADELLRGYCTLVYAQTGSYLETARRLALDRRTVTAKVDRELLARLRDVTASERGGRRPTAGSARR